MSLSSPSMSTYFNLFTYFSYTFLLLLMLLRWRQWHIEKYPSPSPWSHYWTIAVVHIHLTLSATLYTYYWVITSLPITYSPLFSHPIWYYVIYYDRNYDGGSSDFPGLVLSQYCILYPRQAQVFVKSHGTVEWEVSHTSLHHLLTVKEGFWWRPTRRWGWVFFRYATAAILVA